MTTKFITEIATERLAIDDDDFLAVDNDVLGTTFKMKARVLTTQKVDFPTPSSSWVHTNTFNYAPTVLLFDDAGNKIEAEVNISNDNTTITANFSPAASGYMLLS